MIIPMTQSEALLQIIETGVTAEYLLLEADPKLAKRFRKIDGDLVQLLADVQKHFPDATYYTASGGFNLMLGEPHGERIDGGFPSVREGVPQPELIALTGAAAIGDGDF